MPPKFLRPMVGSEIILLCVAVDRANPDPTKDAKGCYKSGDVVRVMPGTAHDGNLVANPIAADWWMVRVVGIPQAVAAKYTEGTPTRRRSFGVTYALLPTSIQTTLLTQRYAVIQWVTLRLAMRNKSTLTTEP